MEWGCTFQAALLTTVLKSKTTSPPRSSIQAQRLLLMDPRVREGEFKDLADVAESHITTFDLDNVAKWLTKHDPRCMRLPTKLLETKAKRVLHVLEACRPSTLHPIDGSSALRNPLRALPLHER